jgi:hypothetical protein
LHRHNYFDDDHSGGLIFRICADAEDILWASFAATMQLTLICICMTTLLRLSMSVN